MASGPLPALIDYYKRLEADPSQTVADFGFSRQKISFVVVIERDGSLHAIQDAREEHQGRLVARALIVPGQSKPSGQGINPGFLWDNGRYMLGFRPEDDDPDRTTACFAAFRETHRSRERDVRDEAFSAVCRFLERWDARKASEEPLLAELGRGFAVFRVRSDQEYVHAHPRVLEYWNRQLLAASTEAPIVGVSLVTGLEEPLARLHEPKIKGVAGAQSSGAVVVGVNDPAYESYGKSQSYNGPVGIRDAFRYTTALNQLLADDSRRVLIGAPNSRQATTVVFWTDRADAKEAEEVFAALFGEEVPKGEAAESGKTLDRIRAFLEAARQGRLADKVRDPEAPFYMLGLSPNASRINVRFWLAGTVGQIADRLARHATCLEMAGAPADEPPLMVRRLLDETVPPRKGWPDRGKMAPRLAGDLVRAVLLGLPYPESLLPAVVARIRAEDFVTSDRKARTYRADWRAAAHRRAAILKAYLVRNKKWEVPVALDTNHPDEAYHLGRLFAALEKAQEDAADRKLNSTIKDRYFSAASASPANVFPLLLKLHQHHMNKIDNVGLRVNREKLVGEICGRISRFPPHLPLAKQGLFYIAYYHQRQDFFTKKDGREKETTDA